MTGFTPARVHDISARTITTKLRAAFAKYWATFISIINPN